MQTLGKAPPARRAGASVVTKPESTSNESTLNSSVPLPQQIPSTVNLGQSIAQHPKWTNSAVPPGPPMNAPSVPPPGPPVVHVNEYTIISGILT